MQQLPEVLIYALTLASYTKYFLVFIGAIIEGPILMVAAGFFLRFDVFSLVPLFTVLVLGDLLADIGWYAVGYYFAEPLIRKNGKFFGVTADLFEKMKKLLTEHQTKILLGSKVTIGFGLALVTIVAAGASKIPIKKYIAINALGEIIMVTVLLSVGYWFGQFYSQIAKGFKEVFLAVGVLFLCALAYGFTVFVRKYIKEGSLKL